MTNLPWQERPICQGINSCLLQQPKKGTIVNTASMAGIMTGSTVIMGGDLDGQFDTKRKLADQWSVILPRWTLWNWQALLRMHLPTLSQSMGLSLWPGLFQNINFFALKLKLHQPPGPWMQASTSQVTCIAYIHIYVMCHDILLCTKLKNCPRSVQFQEGYALSVNTVQFENHC